MELIKNKKNILCCVIILIEFIFIEFPYFFLVGPIGIFGDSEIVINFINVYGKLLKIVSIDNNMLMETFTKRIGSCNIPCAQLARIYVDNWGVVLLVCIPILTNSYVNNRLKRANTMIEVSKFYAVLTLYIMAIIVLLSVIPFICTIKLSSLYDGGFAMEIFKYIGVWLLPSVIVLIGMEMLIAYAIKEPIGQIMIYALLIVPSLPPDVSHYPFYKLVIRFNGKPEAFYFEIRREILLNRIFMIAVAVLIFLSIYLVLRRRRTD